MPENFVQACHDGKTVSCWRPAVAAVVSLCQVTPGRGMLYTLLHKALPMGVKQPDYLARCHTGVPRQAVDAVSEIQHPWNACTSVMVQRVLELHLQYSSDHQGDEDFTHIVQVPSLLTQKQGLMRGLCSVHAYIAYAGNRQRV